MVYGSPIDYNSTTSDELIKSIRAIDVLKLDREYDKTITLTDVHTILPGGPTIVNRILLSWNVPMFRQPSTQVYEFDPIFYVNKLDLISLINYFKMNDKVKLYKGHN